MELRKGSLLIATLEIIILISAILVSHNDISAQTYDTITKQSETTKNNPQIELGHGSMQGSLLGKAPGAIAVDPSTNKIYVANSGSNTVSVINSSSDKVSTIPVGEDPSAIALSPSNKIYVANYISNNISVIKSSSDKVISTIPVGKGPFAIAFSPSYKIYVMYSLFIQAPSTNKIYVANSGSNTVRN